jgi:hypothetical protein
MTERTSDLAGLWIGTAISNTSQSNKAGSTTVKRARLKVKDQVDGGVAIISIKNFPIGLHVMYLFFQGTPRRRDIVTGLRGTIDNIGFGVTRNCSDTKQKTLCGKLRVACSRLMHKSVLFAWEFPDLVKENSAAQSEFGF